MSSPEQVIRHRGGGRDENGQLIPVLDDLLTPLEVVPGGGSEFVERGRDGEKTEFTVYFEPGTDVTNRDELTVRGNRYTIIVNDWRHPFVGSVEVLCSGGQG